MLSGDRKKGRGWGKRGDSKQALRAAVVETLEERRMLAGYGEQFTVEGYSEPGGAAWLPDGGFVASWTARYQGFVRHYDALGAAGSANLISPSAAISGPIGVAADGHFAVAASSVTSSTLTGIIARIFDSTGVAIGSVINVDSQYGSANPDIVMAPDGRFAVCYTRPISGSYYGYGVYIRRFAPDGTPVGSEIQVGSYALLGSPTSPTLAMDASGKMIVAWNNYAGINYLIQARQVNWDGTLVGSVITVDDSGLSYESSPQVAVSATGEWTLAWVTQYQGVRMRRFDANGQPLAPSVLVAANAWSFQLGMAPDGQRFLVWVKDKVVWGQRFSATGTELSDAQDLSNGTVAQYPVLAMSETGQILCLWRDETSASGGVTVGVSYGPGLPSTGLALSGNSVDENVAGVLIGTLSTQDPDTGDTFTYSIVSSNSSQFQIVGNQLRMAQPLDADTMPVVNVSVQSRDSSGWAYTKTFSITVNNLNEAPSSLTLSGAHVVTENQPGGAFVGTLLSYDQDAGDTLTFALASGEGDTDNSSFQVVGTELRTVSVLNYENKKNLSVRLRVTDAGGLWYEKAVVINVSNANDGPTGIDLTGQAVTEEQPGGTLVGVLSAVDEDASETFTYALVGGDGDTDNSSFAIDGQTLTTASGFVYTPTVSYQIRVRVTDSGGLSCEVPFTLGTTPWRPTLSAGGPYQVNAGQVLTLNASVSNSVFSSYTYQWDLDYDGQTFDADRAGQAPVFSTVDIDGPTTRAIALRVRADNGAVSDVVSTTVTIVNAAPTATFASGGNVTLGAAGTVAFSNVRDAAADLAGMRYFYDFNNDGVFEVRKSTSAACVVPASYLATPGKHTVRARIKDSGGLYTDFTADIPVNVPADYSPFVAGLKWRWSGQEDGVAYTETDSIVADTYNGQSVFRCHSDERKSGSTELVDDYVLWNGTGFDLLGAWYPSSSADDDASSLLLGAPIPFWSEALAAGQTLAWSNIPMTVAYTDYPSTADPLREPGQISGSTQFVRFEDVTLSHGLHFKNALVVQRSMTTTLSFTYKGVQITSDSSITDTAWFVRGLGCIKDEESDSARTYASNGYDKTENSTDRSELSSLPAWANYLSFAGDVLQVNGTDQADTITFEVSGENLTCYRNGVPQSVPLASVHGVVINGLGGNDVVNARALRVPVTMAGGGGRDSLVGGHADDAISGGGDADTIVGGGGADAISAGKGNDSVLGQGGEDSLNGGAGNDTLDGGAGDDNLVDASGANVLLGGAGADSIDARNGWRGDVIDGGSEADTVLTDVREGALNAEYCYTKTPKVPGGLAAAAGAGVEGAVGVSVSWSSANWAQSYRIERSLDGSDFELLTSVPGSVLSYADSSVLGGVTYYYRLCAINPIGVSAYGVAASVAVG